MHSTAVWDLTAAILRGNIPSGGQRALGAPLPVWRRVLGFEGCAVQLDHAIVRLGLGGQVPEALSVMLRAGTSQALRHGMLVHRQLPSVAAVATAHGIPVVALKGAARLLAGEPAGARAIADIDLLVAPADAARLHALLQSDLGYSADTSAAPHHLPGLTKPGHLGIEIHHRLSPDATPLDRSIMTATRRLQLGGGEIDVPLPTAMLLHTLEHAVGVNWTGRYRLRDILDTAALCSAEVSLEEVGAYMRSSPSRAALETLVSAAHELEPLAPLIRSRAWYTVRRVSRARVALAMLPRAPRTAERLFRYAGVMAEGSPRTIWRAGSELVARGLAHATAPRS